MNGKVINLIAFVSGAIVGSIITWKVIEEKLAQRSREEIDSVRDMYYEKIEELNGESESKDAPEEPVQPQYAEGIMEYAARLSHLKYSASEDNERGEKIFMSSPYVIDPDDFGMEDGYETVTLTYYSDGVLIEDIEGEVIEDPDYLVGKNFETYFDNEESGQPDVVYIRNDNTQSDYEICRDLSRYADLVDDM